eukprot:841196-Heterocapsa_arctica.AAC.1
MGKSVRKLVQEGLPWQPPASAPIASEAEEAAGQSGQAEGAPAEQAEGAPQNEAALIAPPTPRARAAPRLAEQLETISGPERKKVKEGERDGPRTLSREGERAGTSTLARTSEVTQRGGEAMKMDTSHIVVPEVMKQWRRRE